MQKRLDRKTYRQRRQIEALVSMIKRRLGSFLRGRNDYRRCHEPRLMSITHKLMILGRVMFFY